MDKKTVFLDKLVLPRTIKVLERGVLIAGAAQSLAGRATPTAPGRGHERPGHRPATVRARPTSEHNENALLLALDNWMYTSERHDMLRLEGPAPFEVRTYALARASGAPPRRRRPAVYRNTKLRGTDS
jgi:hypothetical protein